jgi:hypothetical protein
MTNDPADNNDVAAYNLILPKAKEFPAATASFHLTLFFVKFVTQQITDDLFAL